MESRDKGTIVYIYALLDDNGSTVYIGKSSSPKNRCYNHATNFKSKVVMKILDKYYDRESYWIRKFQKEGHSLVNKEVDIYEENWNVGDVIEISKQVKVGVLHTTTGVRFKSIVEASQALGIPYGTLQQTLNSSTRQLNNSYNVVRDLS